MLRIVSVHYGWIRLMCFIWFFFSRMSCILKKETSCTSLTRSVKPPSSSSLWIWNCSSSSSFFSFSFSGTRTLHFVSVLPFRQTFYSHSLISSVSFYIFIFYCLQSDTNWWKGTCRGRTGLIPSNYGEQEKCNRAAVGITFVLVVNDT